jgi:membrane protein DedA with SNARE-associated domain
MIPDSVLQYVQEYGYAAIFAMLMLGIIGVPMPDETMLTFAGFLVYKGHLSLFPTYAAAWLGTVSGITTSYLLGRFVGVGVLNKYGYLVRVTPERIQWVHDWFKRTGKWSLAIGYFIPGVRHVVAIVAGSSKLEYPLFAVFAYAGGLVWSMTFITLGYVLGNTWQKVVAQQQTILLLLGALAIATGLAYLIWRRVKRARA